jgi:hypothetical protein
LGAQVRVLPLLEELEELEELGRVLGRARQDS